MNIQRIEYHLPDMSDDYRIRLDSTEMVVLKNALRHLAESGVIMAKFMYAEVVKVTGE